MEKIDALYLKKYMDNSNEFTEKIRQMFNDVLQVAGLAGLMLKEIKNDGSKVSLVEMGRFLDSRESIIELPVIVDNNAVMTLTACCGNVAITKRQLLNLANIALGVENLAAGIYYGNSGGGGGSAEPIVKEVVKEVIKEVVVEVPVEVPVEVQVPSSSGVDANETLKQLMDVIDVLPSGVMVLDVVKQEVVYMNSAAESSIPAQNALGMALGKYEATGDGKIGEICDSDSGNWYDVTFVSIKWTGGEDVLMGTAIDITQKVKERG